MRRRRGKIRISMSAIQDDIRTSYSSYEKQTGDKRAAALLVIAESIRMQKLITATGLEKLGNAISLGIQHAAITNASNAKKETDGQ